MIVSGIHRFANEPFSRPAFVFVMSLAGALACLHAAPGEEGDGVAPEAVFSDVPTPVTEENFAALKASSPFRRPLDLSKSLVLSGIARIDGDLFATLLDRETRETHIVSRSTNPQGWQIVGVDGDQTDLETVTAQISVAGGEVFSVRFDETQLKPEPRRMPRMSEEQARRVADQAKNYKRGISGDGFRGPPPPEITEKLSKLSEDQRKRLIYEMGEMRNRGVSSEERRTAFTRMVDRALKQRR